MLQTVSFSPVGMKKKRLTAIRLGCIRLKRLFEHRTRCNPPGAWADNPGVPKFNHPALKVPKKDASLQDPNCVLNLLAKHYDRYTLQKVSEVTGIKPELFEEVYKTYAASGAPEKSGTILYALGQTQHSYGRPKTARCAGVSFSFC